MTLIIEGKMILDFEISITLKQVHFGLFNWGTCDPNRCDANF
jgi:hypothetical protein